MNTGTRTNGKQPAKTAVAVWENEGGAPANAGANAGGWDLTGLTRATASDRMLPLHRFTPPPRMEQAGGR
ncbi:hypothetical protein [Oceanibaculum nanhaiense]|jgi:hypothetical protein|uniref:hypothetical protein n=1 Tax=Oceanibaculum nanhaiense TaxID=1909734 RepID=UPI000A383C84|nr:hypothetical protein [Oceanibaculum nanhaiense]